MAKIAVTLAAVNPNFDGRYELDFDEPLTLRELNLIKRISGVRQGELQEAIAADDSDVMLALAVIAVTRSGKSDRTQAMALAEALYDSARGKLSLEPVGDADDPPEMTPDAPAANGEPNENDEHTRPPSETGSAETQETTLASTGALA